MNFLFVSVKHCGLHTCRNVIFKEHTSEYIHIEETTLLDLWDLFGYYDGVIVPMRNPVHVAQSWYSRGLYMDPMYSGFIKIICLAEYGIPYYLLPIDHPDVNDYLDLIDEQFSIKTHREFPVLNAGAFQNYPAKPLEKQYLLPAEKLLGLNYYKDLYS